MATKRLIGVYICVSAATFAVAATNLYGGAPLGLTSEQGFGYPLGGLDTRSQVQGDGKVYDPYVEAAPVAHEAQQLDTAEKVIAAVRRKKSMQRMAVRAIIAVVAFFVLLKLFGKREAEAEEENPKKVRKVKKKKKANGKESEQGGEGSATPLPMPQGRTESGVVGQHENASSAAGTQQDRHPKQQVDSRVKSSEQ